MSATTGKDEPDWAEKAGDTTEDGNVVWMNAGRHPMTRDQLQELGYKRTNYGRCTGCYQPIEWWFTPSERSVPYELMPNPDSEAVSHFIHCPNANQFRKAPHRCTPIYPDSTTQESLFSPSPSSSSRLPPSSSSAPPAPPSGEQPKKKSDA
jgi:hypothetical protein